VKLRSVTRPSGLARASIARVAAVIAQSKAGIAEISLSGSRREHSAGVADAGLTVCLGGTCYDPSFGG
jgi:hypothetical protein